MIPSMKPIQLDRHHATETVWNHFIYVSSQHEYFVMDKKWYTQTCPKYSNSSVIILFKWDDYLKTQLKM